MGNMYKSKLNDTKGGGSTAVLLGTSGIDPDGSAPSSTLQFVVDGVYDYTWLMIEIRYKHSSEIFFGYVIFQTSRLNTGTIKINCSESPALIEVDYGHYGTNTFTCWLSSTYSYPTKIYGININDILP